MSYLYDFRGFYIGEGAGRPSTEIEPTNKSTSEAVGELRSIWNHKEWIEVPYFEPDLSEDLAELKAAKINAVVDLQYQKTNTQIDFNGATLNTDSEAITELTGALDGMRRGKKLSRKVNMRTGRIVADSTTLEAMVDAIDDYRQACHDNGYDLTEAIESATNQAELDQIDINLGWPG